MTVRELIEILEGCVDKDRIVVMSHDPEGNGFSPLSDVERDNAVFVQEGSWGEGSVTIHHLTPSLRREGYTEEDLHDGPGAVRAVVLWP